MFLFRKNSSPLKAKRNSIDCLKKLQNKKVSKWFGMILAAASGKLSSSNMISIILASKYWIPSTLMEKIKVYG